jgi:hypothetical protein
MPSLYLLSYSANVDLLNGNVTIMINARMSELHDGLPEEDEVPGGHSRHELVFAGISPTGQNWHADMPDIEATSPSGHP